MHLDTRGTLRRSALALTAVATAGTVLGLAGPAQAGAPTVIDAEYWGISCVTDLGDGQTLFLTGSGSTDGSEGGASAFIEGPGGSYLEGEPGPAAWGSTFTTTVPIEGHTFTIDAGVSLGPAVVETIDERDGNRWTRGTMTLTEAALGGITASYDGHPVDLADGACHAEVNGFDLRSTNPAGYVSRSEDFNSAICDVAGLADGQVLLSGDPDTIWTEVVLDHAEEDVEKLEGPARIKGQRGSFTADVVDFWTGGVRTTATVDLAIKRDGRKVTSVESADGWSERRTVTPHLATIDVRLADGRRGRASCAAASVVTQTQVRPTR